MRNMKLFQLSRQWLEFRSRFTVKAVLEPLYVRTATSAF